jgi:hypothetical protein
MINPHHAIESTKVLICVIRSAVLQLSYIQTTHLPSL